MAASSIVVEQDVSLRECVDLRDTGNIFFKRHAIVNVWSHFIRAEKIYRKVRRIHVRPLLPGTISVYKNLLQLPAPAFVWATQQDDIPPSHDYQLVLINGQSRLAAEGFVVAEAGDYTRALLTWDEYVHENDRISGVLVTNPDLVRKLSDHLTRLTRKYAH